VNTSRADLRFALPRPVRHAAVLGELESWREALSGAGIEVNGSGARPDVAVAPSHLAREAVTTGASMIVLEGRRFRELSRAGFAVRRYLPLPQVEAPDLILPLRAAGPAKYALERWRPADGVFKRARNGVVAALASAGALPALRPLQAVGQRGLEPPFLVAAATEFGVPGEAPWFMTLGQGDLLTRGVFHLFEPKSAEPTWVLKFARTPGYREPFDRDERGLRIAAAAGPAVAERAPRLLGRLEVEGLHASVETAATGEQLSALVRRAPEKARRKIEEIAAWLVRVGVDTATPPDALADERARLTGEVLPRWAELGVSSHLVDRLPALPGVLQHNDLGTWNIVVREGGFTAIDWESAHPCGLPLWDLLYFLVDALPQLDGARSIDERVEAAIRLLRGEGASSPILFHWLRRAVDETGLPADAVGTLATLCWLHHGLSHVERSKRVEDVKGGSAAPLPPVERIASMWLIDAALGSTWASWQQFK
jgi:hypothetical protein